MFLASLEFRSPSTTTQSPFMGSYVSSSWSFSRVSSWKGACLRDLCGMYAHTMNRFVNSPDSLTHTSLLPLFPELITMR